MARLAGWQAGRLLKSKRERFKLLSSFWRISRKQFSCSKFLCLWKIIYIDSGKDRPRIVRGHVKLLILFKCEWILRNNSCYKWNGWLGGRWYFDTQINQSQIKTTQRRKRKKSILREIIGVMDVWMIAFRTRKTADMMDFTVGTLCIVLLSERVVIFILCYSWFVWL